MEHDPVLLVQRTNERGHFGPQNVLHRTLLRRYDMDFDVSGAQRGRDFEPDEARAEHHRPPRRFRAFDDGPAVTERAQYERVGRPCAGNRWTNRFSAGRQKKSVKRNILTPGERDFARADIDAGDGRAQAKVDGVVGIEAVGAQGEPVLRRAPGEIVLGKIWPVDRRGVVAAQHHDVAREIPPSKHLRGGEPGGAAADNHDVVRRARPDATLRSRLQALFADENFAVALLHPPGIDGGESRRAQGFPGPKVKARVMPGAAHRVVDNEPVGEGAMIVGAMGADREDIGAAARQQHRLVADVAEKLAAIGQVGEGDSSSQIGAGRPGLIFGHSSLLRLTLVAFAFRSTRLIARSDFNIKETGSRRVAPKLP